MSNIKIINIIKQYTPLKKKVDDLEQKFFNIPCLDRNLIEPKRLDHVNYYVCTNKNHIYSMSLAQPCSLKLCPLKISSNDKNMTPVYNEQ